MRLLFALVAISAAFAVAPVLGDISAKSVDVACAGKDYKGS